MDMDMDMDVDVTEEAGRADPGPGPGPEAGEDEEDESPALPRALMAEEQREWNARMLAMAGKDGLQYSTVQYTLHRSTDV